jgi:hypothetical protein
MGADDELLAFSCVLLDTPNPQKGEPEKRETGRKSRTNKNGVATHLGFEQMESSWG